MTTQGLLTCTIIFCNRNASSMTLADRTASMIMFARFIIRVVTWGELRFWLLYVILISFSRLRNLQASILIIISVIISTSYFLSLPSSAGSENWMQELLLGILIAFLLHHSCCYVTPQVLKNHTAKVAESTLEL